VTDGSRFYIDGGGSSRPAGDEIVVVNRRPKKRSRGSRPPPADVDLAVQAGTGHRELLQTTREERIELLTRLREAYKKRIPEIAPR